MSFPVMQFETKYGIDFRVGATEANVRSGSKLIGFIDTDSKPHAIRILKAALIDATEGLTTTPRPRIR